MKRSHNYKVLVTNKKGKVEGVISSIDIIEFLTAPQQNRKELK